MSRNAYSGVDAAIERARRNGSAVTVMIDKEGLEHMRAIANAATNFISYGYGYEDLYDAVMAGQSYINRAMKDLT